MDYMVIGHTDVGIKKATNQDAMMIKIADTDKGKVTLAIICDGMDGLSKGELAMDEVFQSFHHWLELEFPYCRYSGFGQ